MLNEALKNGDCKGLRDLAKFININEELDKLRTRPIHVAVGSGADNADEVISTLIILGSYINKKVKVQGDQPGIRDETALDIIFRLYKEKKIREDRAKHILTTLYLYGAKSANSFANCVMIERLELAKQVFVDAQEARSASDIRIIALLASTEQFKTECTKRGITQKNAQQALNGPAPEGQAPYHTFLYLAALHAPVETVKFLIKDLGLYVDSQSPLNNITPLFGAALNYKPEIIKLLLTHGAQQNKQSKKRDFNTVVKSKANKHYTRLITFKVRETQYPGMLIQIRGPNKNIIFQWEKD